MMNVLAICIKGNTIISHYLSDPNNYLSVRSVTVVCDCDYKPVCVCVCVWLCVRVCVCLRHSCM